jgi:DNA-binding XRE family transcriptional regulator
MTGRNFKLHEVRIRKHWTLRVASQKMAVSMTVLFNAEQGVMPRVDHAIQIARAYGQSVEELWSPPISVAALYQRRIKCIIECTTALIPAAASSGKNQPEKRP